MPTRRERVLALLPDGARGVVLETPGVVSWYLGGARTTVPYGGPSIVAVLVTRDGDEVRCYLNELDRLRDEDGVEDAVPVDWQEPLVPDDWRRDRSIRREQDLEQPLREARASLDAVEVSRYRALAAEVSGVVTDAAGGARPNLAEREIAGQLAERVIAMGAEPVVLLVAGESRLHHRHPLPTAERLGDRAMLVVGARRFGLTVNLTRWLSFDGQPITEGDRRLVAVEAEVLEATVPGARISDVFARLCAAYGANGFDADEWRRHHQGGPTGYVGRDPKVTASTPGVVAENHAFAWNPSARGLKAEDTVLATSAGIELLTIDPRWPTHEVAGRPRPLALQP